MLFRSVIGELFQVDSYYVDHRRHGTRATPYQLRLLRCLVRIAEKIDYSTRGLGTDHSHSGLAPGLRVFLLPEVQSGRLG